MGWRDLKRAGVAIVIGAGQFTFFLTLAEIYYPGYDISKNTISDLGATCGGGGCRFVQPSSDIYGSSVVVLGLLLIIGAYFLGRGSSRSLAVFEALTGAGAIGVGVFNESYGVVHTALSAFVFVSAGIQALLQTKVTRPPSSYLSIVTGVVTLAAIPLYGTQTYLGLGQGGMERMIAYPVLIGGIAFGAHLAALGDRRLESVSQ